MSYYRGIPEYRGEWVRYNYRPVRLFDWLLPVPLFLSIVWREWEGRIGVRLAWSIARTVAGNIYSPEEMRAREPRFEAAK